VHRVTVARWLGAARASLLDGTRRRLAERLGLPSPEVESLVRVLWSQLHISISRSLRR
jgi:RNA polymerase sigma-70 factor (ECF subfamily)